MSGIMLQSKLPSYRDWGGWLVCLGWFVFFLGWLNLCDFSVFDHNRSTVILQILAIIGGYNIALLIVTGKQIGRAHV